MLSRCYLELSRGYPRTPAATCEHSYLWTKGSYQGAIMELSSGYHGAI